MSKDLYPGDEGYVGPTDPEDYEEVEEDLEEQNECDCS